MPDLPSPYTVTPRKRLSSKQRLQLFLDHRGECWLCGGKITTSDRWVAEHCKPLHLDGTNDLSNLRPVHEDCAQRKTSKEAKERSRGRKFIERHLGARKSAKPLPGGKNSPWKKTFYHGWVRRDEE